VIDKLIQMDGRCVTAHECALIHAALREWEQSGINLETATQQRTGWIGWAELEPLLDTLRAHNGFARP
jgi:hypothetical protein